MNLKPQWPIRIIVNLKQCGWCGSLEIRGRHIKFVGLPVIAWSQRVQIGQFVVLSLGVSHGACPRCMAWRISHEQRILRLEKRLEQPSVPGKEGVLCCDRE